MACNQRWTGRAGPVGSDPGRHGRNPPVAVAVDEHIGEVVGVVVVVTLLPAVAPLLPVLRVGRTRAVAAALAGLVGGGAAVGAAIPRPEQSSGSLVAAMVFGVAVVAAMGFLVAAEAVAPRAPALAVGVDGLAHR
jgi:hypothetical protein